MRIAFLTPEYPSETPNWGGLATYLHRMSALLKEAGHEPEIFVVSSSEDVIELDGVRIQRVNVRRCGHMLVRFGHAVARRAPSPTMASCARWLAQAWSLAEAMERRHRDAPFALVQSADFLATGMFVRRQRGRVHAIRCSSSADLYSRADGAYSTHAKLRGWLERAAMRRGDVTYAPSRFLSDHFRSEFGMNVRVIRPPLTRLAEVAAPPFAAPPRYLLHFGQLMARKGTAHIAKALPIAWREAPDLTMMWSGACWRSADLDVWRAQLGENAGRVIYTGPLSRAQVANLLQGADASVLPSEVDNLPNTVIESLAHGIPVIGTRGTSIDEVVEDLRTGHLVDVGDAHGLARAMVAIWRRTSPVKKGFVWDGSAARDMDPATALRNFLALAAAR